MNTENVPAGRVLADEYGLVLDLPDRFLWPGSKNSWPDATVHRVRTAWKLYVELITRVTTQPLPAGSGDECAALQSIYSLFGTTRGIVREGGPETSNLGVVAMAVLNQVVRPFTTKWHKVMNGDPSDETIGEFREELAVLQKTLGCYARFLAAAAGVPHVEPVSP